MADIHVDPSSLREAAEKLIEASDQLDGLGDEAMQVAAGAPSYDGQFGNQVQSMGLEAHASLGVLAIQLSELSDALLLKADEFEAADAETLEGLGGLMARFRGLIDSLARPTGLAGSFPSPVFAWLFQVDEPSPEDEESEPWFGPLAIELAKAWNWYNQNVNQRLIDGMDQWSGIGENGQRIAQYYMAQLWFAYDETVNKPISESTETWQGNAASARTIVLYSLARLWFGFDKTVNQPINRAIDVLPERAENLNLTQGPGPDPTGPLAPTLAALSAVDSSGDSISLVGSELATMIEERGVSVTFLDVNFGVVPLEGRVVLPEYLAGAAPVGAGNVSFAAHEFTHVLERDLNDPAYWPSGWPSLGGARVVGDSTNYMEVVSNIVGLTVEYDVLSQSDPLAPRLVDIQNDLATYADSDPLNATRYLVSESWDPNDLGANAVYRANYVHELTVADHRIPTDGWDYWLREMGFSDAAVAHIDDIASQGSAEYVDPATIDVQTGQVVTPTPSPTAMPSATPTSTSTPTVTPTPTPTPTATPTSTSSTPPPASPSSTPGTPTQGSP